MRVLSLVSALAFVGLLAACGQSSTQTLTNDMAQRAVTTWLEGVGTATVVDVQEIPQVNAAKADVNLDGMKWNSDGLGGGIRYYTGHVDAIFAHYTDGSWALIEIDGPMGKFKNLHIVTQ